MSETIHVAGWPTSYPFRVVEHATFEAWRDALSVALRFFRWWGEIRYAEAPGWFGFVNLQTREWERFPSVDVLHPDGPSLVAALEEADAAGHLTRLREVPGTSEGFTGFYDEATGTWHRVPIPQIRGHRGFPHAPSVREQFFRRPRPA